jgi:hypothetical protein
VCGTLVVSSDSDLFSSLLAHQQYQQQYRLQHFQQELQQIGPSMPPLRSRPPSSLASSFDFHQEHHLDRHQCHRQRMAGRMAGEASRSPPHRADQEGGPPTVRCSSDLLYQRPSSWHVGLGGQHARTHARAHARTDSLTAQSPLGPSWAGAPIGGVVASPFRQKPGSLP